MLALLHQNPQKIWTARGISDELRTSLSSVGNRSASLIAMGLAIENPKGSYQYQPQTERLASLVDALLELYKVRKHTILQLIFSTMKRARYFADAFVINPPSKKDEES